MLGRLKALISDLTTGMCCFCGETIRGEPHQDIVLPYADGSTQHFISHGKCLRARLHPDCPYLTPKEVQDDA